MGYLQEVDRWLDMLLTDLADGKLSLKEMKRDVRERILDSYRNGLKAAGTPPAPRESRPPRRFSPERSSR
jgi:hypothetical protein